MLEQYTVTIIGPLGTDEVGTFSCDNHAGTVAGVASVLVQARMSQLLRDWKVQITKADGTNYCAPASVNEFMKTCIKASDKPVMPE